MRRRAAKAVCAAVSVMAMASAVSGTALALENDKCGGDTLAVADVETDLLVRASASASGEVVGFVPGAGGVLVESVGTEWTKITSGSISGYVKTEYLAFDDKAQELLSLYGVPGAVAAWDDVKVFSDPEDVSSVIGTLNAGEGFEVLGSTENWVEVQLSDGSTAYVAVEDVQLTTVLDAGYSAGDSGSAETSASSETSVSTASESTETSYAEPVYTDAQETYGEDASYAAAEEGYAQPETYADTGYETDYTPETEYVPQTEYTEYTEYTDASQTEYYPETEYTESYVSTETEYTESYDTEASYDDEYIDPSTEDYSAETDSTESSSSYTDSDVELLAALIYCEAGNQSEEGKIAVGQVVMNRVASDSFADTISGVIYESGQFTPASSGWLDSVLGTSEVTDECYQAAVAALNGEGTVGDALYFNAGSGQGVQIGDHQFY